MSARRPARRRSEPVVRGHLRRWLIDVLRAAMRRAGVDECGLDARLGYPPGTDGRWTRMLLDGQYLALRELDEFDRRLQALGVQWPRPEDVA